MPSSSSDCRYENHTVIRFLTALDLHRGDLNALNGGSVIHLN